MRNTFIDTILAASATRDDIFIISGDAGLGVFDSFKEQYPERFLNLGVAEQNTISFAAGLALTGSKVLIYNIIPFVLYRCFEQVRNDICYQKLPVILVGIGSGITYAPMGMTHYSVEDLGLIQTLPNLVTISPMDPVEARVAAQYALDATAPVYVRLAKRGEPVFHSATSFDISVPQVVREGTGCAVLFHGSISNEVMAAWDILKDQGHAPALVSVPMVQPLDTRSLAGMLSGYRQVISVEEHFVTCGLGSMLARFKAESSAPWGLTTLGIPFNFIHDIRNCAGLRENFGIAAADIVAAVRRAGEPTCP
jgi:transketolase